MQRTREQTKVLYTVLDYRTVTQGPKWSAYAGIKPTNTTPYNKDSTKYSKMVDDDAGWGQFNDCIHITDETWRNTNVRRWSIWDSVSSGLVCSVEETQRCGYNFDSSVTPVVSYFSGPMESWAVPDYSGEAVRAMWPEIKAKVSLINSIVELKDFRRLPGLMDKAEKTIADLCKVFVGKPATLSLRELVRQVSETYLTSEFAYKPFESDCNAVLAALTEVRARMKVLLENEDKLLVGHYRRYLSDRQFGLGYDTPKYVSSAVWDNQGTCESVAIQHWNAGQPPVYCATMLYSYHFADYQRQYADLLGVLDALGINANPAVIWNMIPWSFVIDWFARVSTWLDRFKERMMEPMVRIHRFTHSVKYRLRTSVFTQPYYTWQNNHGVNGQWRLSSVPKTEVAYRERTWYVRKRSIPQFMVGIQGSNLSLKEMSLALALTDVNLRRRAL